MLSSGQAVRLLQDPMDEYGVGVIMDWWDMLDPGDLLCSTSWESAKAAIGIGHCPVVVTIALPLLLLC